MGYITTKKAYDVYKEGGMKTKPLAEVKEILGQLDKEPHKGQISYTGPSAKGKKLVKRFSKIVDDPKNYR